MDGNPDVEAMDRQNCRKEEKDCFECGKPLFDQNSTTGLCEECEKEIDGEVDDDY